VQAEKEYQLDGFGEEGPELSEYSRLRTAALHGVTVANWLASVRQLVDRADLGRPAKPGTPSWNLNLIDAWEWRHALRLLLVAFPDEDVELDLTDLFEGGWLEAEGSSAYLPSVAMGALRQSLASHAPIVVLTEGRNDSEFLEAALALTHPHLKDLIRFLDFDARPEGGAAALVKSVKAFASAGITNRVVALFDNDAAARDALRALDVSSLPDNIRVLRYPAIDLAANYPTLGPPNATSPGASIDAADVNGLAGSIEIYLGADVLTQDDGTLTPVQWRSYIAGVNAYQGEVTGKGRIHTRFREKLAATRPADTQSPTWGDLRAVLQSVIDAFADRPLPHHICDHTGRSEVSIRLRLTDS
jgi:hypothetical protein